MRDNKVKVNKNNDWKFKVMSHAAHLIVYICYIAKNVAKDTLERQEEYSEHGSQIIENTSTYRL